MSTVKLEIDYTRIVGTSHPLDPVALVNSLLDAYSNPWLKNVEIITDYMPPYPNKDTKPTCQIRYNDGRNPYMPYLRYGPGPVQTYFWDIYGEDFICVELALVALSRAPAPRSVAPTTFTVPIKSPT